MTNENTSKAVSTGTQQRVRGVPFKPGQSGNPAGRKPGSRNKLVEDFVSDLQEKWRTDGTDILNRVAANEPAKIVEVISRLAPKDIAVKLEERNSLGIDPALWNGFKRVLAAIEECAPSDTNPVEVFDAMERWVRSEFAVPIEGGDGKPLLLSAKNAATEKMTSLSALSCARMGFEE